MRESTFYFSDAHLGAGKKNLELVCNAFDALTPFLRENSLRVTRAVDLGDHVEHWLPGMGFEKRYEDNQIVGATRLMYRRLFYDRQPVVLASAGNHQTDILDSDCTADEAMASSEKACEELRIFLEKRVFARCPDADVTVFRGLRQTEDHVFAHHGDFLDKQDRFRSVLSRLNGNMTVEQKMEYINSQPEIYEGMQERWQWFRENLWPALGIPFFVKVGFPLLVSVSKLKALRREKKYGDSSRTRGGRRKNPIYDSVQLQLELLQELTNEPEKHAIVSGHTHVPGMVSGVNEQPGTVVTLGAWHDTHLKPAVGISTQLNGKKVFVLPEYDSATNRWNIRDEKGF